MKHASLHTALCSAIGAIALLIPCARADVPGINMDFEDYELGELLGQGFWGAHPGWVNSWEIVDHEGPDGTITRCLATTELCGSNWPRAETTFTTADLTKYGWPTPGRYSLSFDLLYASRNVKVTVHCLAAATNKRAFGLTFQPTANNGAGRINGGSWLAFAGLATDIDKAAPRWHHFEAIVDYSTDTYRVVADGSPVNNSAEFAFEKSSADIGGFGQIILQSSYAPNDESAGFYMDNIVFRRLDTDPSEITVVVFR